MSGGYFKVFRSLINSEFWLQEPFTRGQAWVDLIGMARHKDGYKRKRGIRVESPRGTVVVSEPELAGRWQWSRGKIRRFLRELEMEQQIVQQKCNVSTLITIINYEKFQGSDTADDTEDGQQTVQQTDSNYYNRKKGKKGKNVNNKEKDIGATEKVAPVSVLKSYPYPEWLNKDLWSDFHRMRSKIKKPITTERTITGLIKKLKSIIDDGHNQDDIIQASIDGCWQTFYPPKGNSYGYKPKTNTGPHTGESRGSDGGCSKYDGITQTIVDCG